ncbi:hypothetical protein [Luteolibacter luteus]|uniref:Uncharacterized protein n=1 Tax=Luteolibacter luteus TaxID=2728835 RepID=A0A858RGA5_9BACT|nr:hypothetical protein [Luteolibacter luteus]QJE95867.1 hypothetical protein HHL09_08765 [Luteolibacter luteus]
MKPKLVFLPLLSTSLIAGEPLPSTGPLTDAKASITPAPPTTNPWRIGAGVMWRTLGETTVSPNLGGGALSGNFPEIGDPGEYADRFYDDGHVGIGAATPGTGLTTNWSYQNSSQVAGDTLSFTRSGFSGLSSIGGARDDDSSSAAPYVEISYMRPIGEKLEIGPALNFSFTNLDSSIARSVTGYDVSVTDTYDLGGVIPPEAPYEGSFEGPGPLIPNIPASRDALLTPVSRGSYLFESDVDLYSLALGCDLHWKPTASWYIGAGAGAVVNYADWEARWRIPMTLPGAVHRGYGSDQEFLGGLYVKANAGYRINEQWSVDGFVRYDWNEDLEGQAGRTSFKTDLSGWSTGFSVGFHF